MKVFKMAITTENEITSRLSQEVVEILAENYHSAVDKYRSTIPHTEKILDIYVF